MKAMMHDESEQAQQPAAATPGRWTAVTGHGEYDVMGDTAICRMFQDPAINSGPSPDAAANARLIVAAVNAVREAGYAVEDLEGGRPAYERQAAMKQYAALRETLAACRDALCLVRTTCERVRGMNGYREGADIWVGAEIFRMEDAARALLTRLDA